MARTGMANLISTVRDLGVAGTADYTLGTTTYWTDDQLQTILDRNKLSVRREELQVVPSYDGGTLVYKEYRSQFGNYEQTTGGTAIFEIENAIGETVGTASWTMDYANGVLTFSANTAGSSYFLSGDSYDIYRAAADVWRTKAGHHSGAVDFSTDNMTVNRGQMIQNDREMASYYAGMGRVKIVQYDRDDTV